VATLTINDNPSIADTIVFTLTTPDSNGCLLANPYKVDKVVIYYVQRDFNSGNLSEYSNETYDETSLRIALKAEAIACESPTPENINAAKIARINAEGKATINSFYFNEAKPVQTVGNDEFPAWFDATPTDLANSFLELVTEDASGNPLYGTFTYTWQPVGMREGDYFICWTWTPLVAGDSISSHIKFYLQGDTQITTSIPTHFTDPDKYPTLLDRYLPEMFKMIISDNDRSPDVLDKLNGSVALGFNVLEDLANQIVDLQDANSVHEALIPYLSNLFDLKLRTNDPTRWRGQIKRAIPLFKNKGTKAALAEAMEHAAIHMLGFTQLWQIVSSYTWQDFFISDGINQDFILQKVALPIDFDNFELWIRYENSNDWTQLSSDYIEFNTAEGVTTMTWIGGNLSVNPIVLQYGDEIRVLYKYNEVPDITAQSIENFIRSLPLMDQRDERDQIYPLKNWNVRVIEENNPMLDVIIPNKHPFHDPVIFGKVRTEFPYSENIYNMEEYNGSIRNSSLPCDIDRNFIDPCTACISSSYNIDLEIENISDDRISEALDVLKEYTPFHAVLHKINFIGGINEFIQSPIEEIETLVAFNTQSYVLAGEGQTYFNRVMKSVMTEGIFRNQLSNSSLELTTSATAYNDSIVVFSPTNKLDNIGMSLDGDAVLHILSPSPLAGRYGLSNPKGNVATISPIPGSEPIADCGSLFANDETLNTCAFAFDINNTVINGESLCAVNQDNLFILGDSSQNFGELGVKSLFDVDHGTASYAWAVLIPDYDATAYDIADVLPDGRLVLINHGNTLPDTNASGVSYTLKDNLTTIMSSTSGDYQVTKRGRITVLNSNYFPISDTIDIENFYFEYNLIEYPVIGFVSGTNDQFYIGNYSGGDLGSSINLKINRRLISQDIGYLSHRGLKLLVSGDLESSLGIQNGANSLVVVDDGIENNKFKENFIIVIGSDSYFIADINGNSPTGFTTITLSGVDNYWKTISSGGTSVTANFYNYTVEGATIMGQQYDLPTHTFRKLNRSGSANIDEINQDGVVTGLNIPEKDGISEFVEQKESISFQIEYKDGTKEEGKL